MSTDIIAECVERECGHTTFVISVKEQQFYASQNLALPKRCKPCRARRRANVTATPPRSANSTEHAAAESGQHRQSRPRRDY